MNPDDQIESQEATTSTSTKLAISRSVESARYCWVCFATDEDDENAAWVQPCNCRGTTKWVSFFLNSTCQCWYLHLEFIVLVRGSVGIIANKNRYINLKIFPYSD